jgi:hypothetical protein
MISRNPVWSNSRNILTRFFSKQSFCFLAEFLSKMEKTLNPIGIITQYLPFIDEDAKNVLKKVMR